jgi:ornithine carbamoyltransferase
LLNNVANCLIEGALMFGVRLRLVTPLINDASLDDPLMQEALASELVTKHETLAEGVAGADYVYTDTWIDMENFHNPSYAEERERRIQIMRPFTITVGALGDKVPYIMHDMPIHPGFEIEMDAINHEKSIIYRQAENRMHVAEALLISLLH